MPNNESKLTHLNEAGEAHMVDVGAKQPTRRRAVARALVTARAETVQAVMGQTLGKGDALAVARVAGIMAAKKTSELIPLCHPLPLTSVSVEIDKRSETEIGIVAIAECVGQTGVEMEALTACTVAALTLYDMAKSIDRAMSISSIQLVEKSGGKSGDWSRPA